MEIKFSFLARGILTIAAFAMFLYAILSLGGRSEIGAPLLNISAFIVIAFIIYMFTKLLMRRF